MFLDFCLEILTSTQMQAVVSCSLSSYCWVKVLSRLHPCDPSRGQRPPEASALAYLFDGLLGWPCPGAALPKSALQHRRSLGQHPTDPACSQGLCEWTLPVGTWQAFSPGFWDPSQPPSSLTGTSLRQLSSPPASIIALSMSNTSCLLSSSNNQTSFPEMFLSRDTRVPKLYVSTLTLVAHLQAAGRPQVAVKMAWDNGLLTHAELAAHR